MLPEPAAGPGHPAPPWQPEALSPVALSAAGLWGSVGQGRAGRAASPESSG